ncbi:hypothetical protein IE077_001767 [Cardiosporidium cionae]|uniref:RecQ-mediated genome instability protein 1 n=1 Tax=Cardiosporidium cionae TaxID=476202 RepID=A0ABQ7JCE0_9APIC|nr:hypothetical protein IE077_001767 [Cardiosporidium cionae]|eukprot:KAF8821649.1 hypothetical protein IE077_001767 [Cardiosporidium cionae]
MASWLAPVICRFRSKGIALRDDWLACCHNISTEHELYHLFCYSDMLLSSSGTLPLDLPTRHDVPLEGCHVVQVEAAVDIHKPLSSKEPANGKNQEKRCLKMFLTDGKIGIIALEYRRILCLRETSRETQTKILVCGEPLIRRGVLLLEERHVLLLFDVLQDQRSKSEHNMLEETFDKFENYKLPKSTSTVPPSIESLVEISTQIKGENKKNVAGVANIKTRLQPDLINIQHNVARSTHGAIAEPNLAFNSSDPLTLFTEPFLPSRESFSAAHVTRHEFCNTESFDQSIVDACELLDNSPCNIRAVNHSEKIEPISQQKPTVLFYGPSSENIPPLQPILQAGQERLSASSNTLPVILGRTCDATHTDNSIESLLNSPKDVVQKQETMPTEREPCLQVKDLRSTFTCNASMHPQNLLEVTAAPFPFHNSTRCDIFGIIWSCYPLEFISENNLSMYAFLEALQHCASPLQMPSHCKLKRPKSGWETLPFTSFGIWYVCVTTANAFYWAIVPSILLCNHLRECNEMWNCGIWIPYITALTGFFDIERTLVQNTDDATLVGSTLPVSEQYLLCIKSYRINDPPSQGSSIRVKENASHSFAMGFITHQIIKGVYGT